jgi:hypothetical protein
VVGDEVKGPGTMVHAYACPFAQHTHIPVPKILFFNLKKIKRKRLGQKDIHSLALWLVSD